MVARRAIAAGAAAALALSVLSGRGMADVAESCDQATLSAGTVAGVVGASNPEDWWRMPALPGSYVVTLANVGADLSVGNAGCGTLCDSANLLTPDRCLVRTSDGALTLGIRSSSRYPAAYAVSVEPLMPAIAECADRIDNDGDGVVDFPADSGCTSAFDTVEDDGACSPFGPVDVCYELVTGSEQARFQRDVPESANVPIAAYLRWYKFTVMGVPVTVACVDVLDPVESHPCREARGRFTGAQIPLYDDSVDVADATKYQNVVVRVCDATLNVTVNGRAAPPIGVYKTPC